jgi:hypothetical protein
MATHAICNKKKGWTRISRVLVALSHEADVGSCCIAKVKGHDGYF